MYASKLEGGKILMNGHGGIDSIGIIQLFSNITAEARQVHSGSNDFQGTNPDVRPTFQGALLYSLSWPLLFGTLTFSIIPEARGY
jgi:hypothetical protein